MTGAVSSLLRKWLTERESVKKIQIKCRYPCVHSTKYYTSQQGYFSEFWFWFGRFSNGRTWIDHKIVWGVNLKLAKITLLFYTKI